MASWGLELERSQFRPVRDLVGGLEVSAGGNVAVRIGRELDGGGWVQVAYVVLTPAEARGLAGELETLAG